MAAALHTPAPAVSTWWGCCCYQWHAGLQRESLLWLFYSIPALDDQFCRGCISSSFCALVLAVQGKGARMPHFHLKVPILTNPLLKTNRLTTSRALGTMLVSGNALRPRSSGVEQDRHIATAFPYGGPGFMKTSLLGARLTKGSFRLGQQQHLMKAATEKH